MPMPQQFSRMVKISIPVSPTTGAVNFDALSGLPKGQDGLIRNDLNFIFENKNRYDVALEGWPQGSTPSNEPDPSLSWVIMARSKEGPYTSKKPAFMRAKAIDHEGCPLPQFKRDGVTAYDYSGDVISLYYGVGI